MNKERIEKIIYDLKRSVHDGLEYASDIHIIITSLETLEEVRELAKEGSEILKYGNPDNVNGYEISGVEGYQDACSEILAILNKGEK